MIESERAGIQQDEATPRWALLLWVAGCATAVLVLGVVAGLATDRPSPVALVLFSILSVTAESVAAAMLPTARVSPRFMVVMASIAAFEGHGVVLGATIVGLFGGVALYQLRQRRYRVLAFNCAQSILSAAAAAGVYTSARTVPGGWLAALVAAGLVYAGVNVALVLPGIVADTGAPPADVWADMAPALPNYLAFGLLGTLIGGVYGELGPFALVLLVAPVAIARSTYRSYLELQEAHEATVRVLLRALEAKDEYTAAHTRRVAKYSEYIGAELGLSRPALDRLRHVALVHDVGKLAVPGDLLRKPGKLTVEEFGQVQRHVTTVVDILSGIDFLRPLTAAAAGHHTRYDGQGYGSRGGLPIEAAIVAVADAFDAMTSTRSYRKALSQDVALAELRQKAGTQLHPDCVEALASALAGRGERYGAGYEHDRVQFDIEPPQGTVGSAGLGDLLPSRS